MKLNHKILETFLKYTNFLKVGEKNDTLRVLMYHDIPPNLEKEFRDQISFLRKNWNFITPLQFENFINKNIELKGNNLLLTFDDGFISSKIIAEKFLSDFQIQAIFFVMSDFIEIKDLNSCRDFISKNIIPGTDKDHLPNHLKNMQWEDIKFLQNMGHTIGAHTKSHKKLSDIDSSFNLNKEICYSADLISNKINQPLNHFAYSFGNLSSFSENAYKIALNKFPYIYSGIRGNNINKNQKDLIFRDEVNPTYSNILTEGFLKGITDFKYKKSANIFNKWKKNILDSKNINQ